MTINQYTQPVQNSLEQYIPLPLDTIFKAGQAIQQRGDLAQQQNDQFQTGLASAEALAPTHRNFMNNYVNDYRTQQANLLDKYNGNTSDPTYEREARRLNMQFAADPRLKVIQQANELYKQKEKIKDELEAKGIKYLDSNPNYNGIDSHGNLTANVGNLRATEFDKNIDNSFKAQENAMEQHGGVRTNRFNLHRNLNSYLSSWDTNPDVQEGLQFYRQKGYSEDQAKAAVLNTLNQAATKYTKDDKDHFYEQMAWEKWKFAQEQAAKAAKNPETVAPGMLDANQSPFVAEQLGKDKMDLVDRVIANTNEGGGIKKGTFSVADTPENRKAYAGRFYHYNEVDPDALGAEGGVTSKLKITGNGYNQDESKLVDEARDVLGDKAKNSQGHYLSDRTVLTKYKQALSATQSATLNYHAPLNTKYANDLTDLEFGKNLERLGSNYIVITNKGKYASGTKEADAAIKDIKHVAAIGTNAAPVGNFPSGTVAANAVTKDNSSVTIIKPMSPSIASNYLYSNKASSALLSNLTNSELLGNQGENYKIKNKATGIVYVPQKGLTPSGAIGISYYPTINGKIDKSTPPLNISDIENGEHANFFSRLGQSIGTKPEDQNFQ